MPSTLHRLRELPLVLGADAGVLRIDDLRLARHEAFKKPYLLIVNGLQVLGTEKALDHG